MKSKFIICCLFTIHCFLLTGCEFSFGDIGGNSGKTYDVTLHYYDNVVRNYSVTKGKDTQVAMLAPSGKRITGIYSSDNLMQSDWKCVINAKNWDDEGYEDLYVEYADGLTSYAYEEIAYWENPKLIDFYAGGYVTFTIQYGSGTSTQGEFISSILCNEFADLNVHASFEGKGDGTPHYNTFKSHIKIGDDTLNSFEQTTLSSTNAYQNFSYYGTIRPKQLISNSYKVQIYVGAKYGYNDYTIKNLILSFSMTY
jgi:hypothetical protein